MALRHKKVAAIENDINESFRNMSDDELFQFAGFDDKAAEKTGYSNYSYWRSTLRSFLKDKNAMFFLILVLAILLFTFIQPLIPGQRSPTQIFNDASGIQIRNQTPNSDFWFGTNSIGQDLWSRVWSGTRTSLLIGFAVAISEAVIGILVGLLWGYVRKLDRLITEVYNVLDNIPQTIVLILFSYILHPSISTLIIAMCLTGWLDMARFIRNQVVIIRDRDYNLASRCLGTPTRRIIYRNLLPYLISVIVMRMALAIPGAIGNEVFLTYIGLGLPVSIPSLGNLIDDGRKLMTSEALRYQLFFPAIVLSVVTIAFYIIGNAFADASDPKNHL
ncbi:MAG TPA: ABC transporter permease [Caproicibacter sp.]|nr:ABC transporter permease [Caproicibacter sp.]